MSNYEKSKRFYELVLSTIDYKPYMDLPEYKVAGFSDAAQSSFWINQKEPRENTHVAFLAASKAEVIKFYKKALAAGAKDNGAPGYRPQYSPSYYAAFVYDLDHNNIEAVWFDKSKNKAATKTKNKSKSKSKSKTNSKTKAKTTKKTVRKAPKRK